MIRTFTAEERGRAAAASQAGRAERRLRHLQACGETVDALVAGTDPLPEWARRHATKARRGNVRSLIALKCADCVAFQRAEIAHCPVVACTLHVLRPYRR